MTARFLFVLVSLLGISCDAFQLVGKSRERSFSLPFLSYKQRSAAERNLRDVPPSENATIRPRRPMVVLKTISESFQILQERHGNLTVPECHAVLNDCVENNQWETVLAVLGLMNDQGIARPETFRMCLHGCLLASNANVALQVLQMQILAGNAPTCEDVSLVVFTQARESFPQPQGWKKALNLLNHYQEITPGIFIYTYDAVLTCMVEQRQWQESIRLLRRLETSQETESPKPTKSTYRLVVECCVKARKADPAVRVLRSAVEHGVTPSLYTFELICLLLCEQSNWRQALQLLELMDRLSVRKTLQLCNSVLASMSRAGEVAQAKNLLQRMKRNFGIQPDVISFNSLVSVCARRGYWKDALKYLDACQRSGVQPDVYTYTNAIRACAKGGQLTRALSLLQVCKDKRLPLDAYVYTAAIDACSKCREWKKAIQLLEEMEALGILPTEISYSATIAACGNAGQWEKALDLIGQMKERRMKPGKITYNNALTALSKAARSHPDPDGASIGIYWEHAEKILQEMDEQGCEKDGFTYSAALGCCGDNWKQAVRLIEKMRQSSKTKPNKIAYTTAISSCGKAGESGTALALFADMTRIDSIRPDSYTYNALLSSLKDCTNSSLILDLWETMVHQGRTARSSVMNVVSPDMITVTNALRALDDDAVTDRIYAEAVKLRVPVPTIDLDSSSVASSWEVDLSGTSLPVARAACRFVFQRVLQQAMKQKDFVYYNLVLKTGKGSTQDKKSSSRTSLRDYVQDILGAEFSVDSNILFGAVHVSSVSIQHWVQQQQLNIQG